MSKTDENGASGRSTAVPWILMGFVLVYFLFPHAFILPFFIIYGSPDSVPPRVDKVMQIALYPVIWLSRTVPAYDWLLEKESELTGF